jgi:hypothetical protein
MAKSIILRHGCKAEIKAALQTTYPTVRQALNYRCDSEISRKIRHVAVTQYKGVEIEV